jgi:hypothetical protein
MKDEQFGVLEWDDLACARVTSVSIDYFRDLGATVLANEVERGHEAADPMDPLTLARQGKFLLTIPAPTRSNRPTAAQRLAWQKVLDRGDQLWDEMMGKILVAYRAQRPARARWWKAIYGDAGLDQALPDIDTADLTSHRKLVFPCNIRVQPAAGDGATPDVGIQFACTWCHDGFGVLIRDGQIAAVGPGSIVFPESAPQFPTKLDHPVLGALRRRDHKEPWLGKFRCDPFTQFDTVASVRAAFRTGAARDSYPRSELGWDFANGMFHFLIHAPAGRPPTAQQAKAFAAFKANEKANAATIIEAIFEFYNRCFQDRRREYRGDYLDDAIPELKDARGLQSLIALTEVNVFPTDRTAPVAIGMAFASTWADNGVFALRVRDGKVEEIGNRRVARP